MRMPLVRVVVLAVGVLCSHGSPPECRAQEGEDYSNKLGVSLGAGTFKLVGGKKDHTSISPLAQFGLRFGWRRDIDLEVTARAGLSWDDTKTYRNRQTSAEFDALYSRNPGAQLVPQLFGGAGVTFWSVMNFRGQASPGLLGTGRIARGFQDDGGAALLSSSNFNLFGGLGAEYGLSQRLLVRVGARLDYLFKQHLDNTGASDTTGTRLPPDVAARRARAEVDANVWVPAAFIGVTWLFREAGSGATPVESAPVIEPIQPMPMPAMPPATPSDTTRTKPATPPAPAPAPKPDSTQTGKPPGSPPEMKIELKAPAAEVKLEPQKPAAVPPASTVAPDSTRAVTPPKPDREPGPGAESPGTAKPDSLRPKPE